MGSRPRVVKIGKNRVKLSCSRLNDSTPPYVHVCTCMYMCTNCTCNMCNLLLSDQESLAMYLVHQMLYCCISY